MYLCIYMYVCVCVCDYICKAACTCVNETLNRCQDGDTGRCIVCVLCVGVVVSVDMEKLCVRLRVCDEHVCHVCVFVVCI